MDVEMENAGVSKCVIITGMSGAGKSTALKILEDQGMFAIDNIPPALLSQLIFILEKHRAAVRWGVAAVVDVRGDSLLDDFPSILALLRKQVHHVSAIFFDAQDDVLLRRFESTRRRHPMTEGSLVDGIARERERLKPILDCADTVIDTSALSLTLFRSELVARFFGDSAGVPLIISSFGFKHGAPADCDFIFDVRFLDNPFYNPDLKHLSGKESAVQEAVWSSAGADAFWEKLTQFLDIVIPLYLRSGKTQLHIGIGCTGGRHRSVAVAERLCAHLQRSARPCILRHRDVDREQGW